MTVYDELADFKPAIAWLATNDLIAKVPSYDPAKGDAGFARDLEALCGKRSPQCRPVPFRQARADQAMGGSRSRRRRIRASYSCLTYAAIAAGHELRIFDK